MRIYAAALLCCIALSCPPDTHAGQSPQAAFSPAPEAVELIERTIARAKASIDVAAYSFTSYKIADALIDAHRRGVEVRVLLDKAQGTHRYHAIEDMAAAGILIRVNDHYRIMHDKFLIVDDKTVETGSFNYTASAERRNAENVIVIRNNKKLARQFLENWQQLWGEGEEYQ